MKSFFLAVLIVCMAIVSCSEQKVKDTSSGVVDSVAVTPKYKADFADLAKHESAPRWFKDSKFGIYFHWGVYSVPAFGDEWYPRNMNIPGSKVNKYHIKTYGKPDEFGYHEFVKDFTAENFNAEEWAQLFKDAGAQFAGPVAEHHDGFSMWDSDITPWNSMDKGPKQDVTGELAKAIKSRDMKFITTFHHARNLNRYQSDSAVNAELTREVKRQSDRFWRSHYPTYPETVMANLEYGSELAALYGKIPEEEWVEKFWYGKVEEVVNKYEPDIIWFDSWLEQIPEEYRAKMCAMFLNKAEELGKEVVIVRKQDDLPINFTVDDLERSRKNKIEEATWMTDAAISPSSWCYTDGLEVKKSKDLIHILVDITSKNGVLLLNISPMKNGTIPEDQKKVLLEMGQWLKTFGESIYGTKAWYTFGEGPTKEPKGHFSNHHAFQKLFYTNKDIRFTKKGDVVYVTQFGSPKMGSTLVMKSFDKAKYPVKKVVNMKDGSEMTFTQDDKGLSLMISGEQDDSAQVYKVML